MLAKLVQTYPENAFLSYTNSLYMPVRHEGVDVIATTVILNHDYGDS